MRLLLPLLLLGLAAAPAAAQACHPALVAEAETGIVRLSDGRVFLPADPEDAGELAPGDVVFACEEHLQESEGLFPIPGRWQPEET